MSSSQDLAISPTFSDIKSISQPLSTIREEVEQHHKNRPWVSFLEKSKKVLINNSTVTAIGQVKHVYNYYINSPPGMTPGLRMLGRAVAHEAMYDSRKRYHRNCDLVAYRPVLSTISAWATDLTKSARLLWVTSPPGANKSLLTGIAQSVAEQLDEQGCLGGCFFFDKDIPQRNRETALFPTLAYQFVKRNPEMRAYVVDPISIDSTDTIATQFRNLITGPFQSMMHLGNPYPPVLTIILDALQDCSTATVQLEILRMFLAEVKQKAPIPLRFLIFSEPFDYVWDLLDDYATSDLVECINVQRQCAGSSSPMSVMINPISHSPDPLPMKTNPIPPSRGSAVGQVSHHSPHGSAMSVDQVPPHGSAMSVDRVWHRSSLGSAMRVDQVPHRSSHGSAMSVDQVPHNSVHRRAMRINRASHPMNIGTAPHSFVSTQIPFADREGW